jgi:K+-transporting ATPase c subunit
LLFTVYLSTIKATLHWIFGYGFSADLTLNIAFLPIIGLMLVFILTLLMEYMIRKKPKGSILATYGSFLRVLELVDKWNHQRFFWGDKWELIPGLRPQPEERYQG